MAGAQRVSISGTHGTYLGVENPLVVATKSAVSDEKALKLRLIEEASGRKKPRWMKHYRTVSYVIYSCIATYSLFYLLYIGVYQAHPRMQIQYLGIVRFLEYNSYSILSPLLCPIFMGMLIYQVKKEIALAEGDFFGVLGAFLFLALVNFHDAFGIYHQVQNTKDYNPKTPAIDPPPENPSSRNDLAWQYAWSTRPNCAKHYVRNLNYQHEYEKKHTKRQVLIDYGIAQQRALHAENARAYTGNSSCNAYHDKVKVAKTRQWMIDMQREFKCCGPYGFKAWRKLFSNDKKTGCNLKYKNPKTGDIRSCYDPLMKWLNKILFSTVWIMTVQGVLYLLAMLTALAHHTAMKYEKSQVVKSHSLLEITSDPMHHDGMWWRDTRPVYKPMVVGSNIHHEEETDQKGAGIAAGKAHETKTDVRASPHKTKDDKHTPGLNKSKM